MVKCKRIENHFEMSTVIPFILNPMFQDLMQVPSLMTVPTDLAFE